MHELCNGGRFLDPLFFGEYPPSMQKLVGKRLPKITPKMSRLLVGSLDFLGINHYTTLYARNDRTRIRKLVLQDAATDAAVITTCKMPKHWTICVRVCVPTVYWRRQELIVFLLVLNFSFQAWSRYRWKGMSQSLTENYILAWGLIQNISAHDLSLFPGSLSLVTYSPVGNPEVSETCEG